jgi:hypothetical protein
MHASLRALLTGLIDYAGLFPPAELPLEEAIRNYARYRTEPESWMLGRFICPAGKLEELGALVPQLFRDRAPLPLSVLAGKAATGETFGPALRQDIKLATAFQARLAGLVRVEVVETRLPASAGGHGPEVLAQALEAVHKAVTSELPAVTPFFEITLGPGWCQTVAEWVLALKVAASANDAEPRAMGLKLRCGGLDASAFPSVEQVADVLTECRNQGVAMKATAGLHHPLRRFHRQLRTHMHGFVNLFGAAALAHSHRELSVVRVQQILDDENPSHFVFDDDGFRWGDFFATTTEIAAAREQLATSFGSCSFDEPRDDLRALGWL